MRAVPRSKQVIAQVDIPLRLSAKVVKIVYRNVKSTGVCKRGACCSSCDIGACDDGLVVGGGSMDGVGDVDDSVAAECHVFCLDAVGVVAHAVVGVRDTCHVVVEGVDGVCD